jgi:hypothetical protein
MKTSKNKRMNRHMDALQARALLFQRKLKYEDFKGSIPDVPELDDQLGILELPANEAVKAEKLAKGADGETDEALQLGALVARGLVFRGTKERLFSDEDIEGVAAFGLSVLNPIAERIREISGLSEKAVDESKKS